MDDAALRGNRRDLVFEEGCIDAAVHGIQAQVVHPPAGRTDDLPLAQAEAHHEFVAGRGQPGQVQAHRVEARGIPR